MSLVQHPTTDLALDSSFAIQSETNAIKVPLETMASVALAAAPPSLSAVQKNEPIRIVTEESAEHTSQQRERELQNRLENAQVAGALQRANLTQARRVGGCLRAAYEA